MTWGEVASFSFGNVRVKIDRPKALLVLDDDDGEHWIPKSQIHDDSEVWQSGQEGDLVVTEWFADKAGWL